MDFIVFVRPVEIRRRVLNNLYILDTNVLMELNSLTKLLGEFNHIEIPIEVLSELDNLKTTPGDKGFKARKAIRNIESNLDKITIIQHSEEQIRAYKLLNLSIDDIIVSYCKNNKDSILITNDISMRLKAGSQGILTIPYKEEPQLLDYIYETEMDAESLKNFTESNKENIFNVPIGQFLGIKTKENPENQRVFRYLGNNEWSNVSLKKGLNNYLFKVEPKDIYQSCAIYSLNNDDFTVIIGPAGTGKTLLSFAYCLKEIKSNNKKVHIFVNPVKTRDSEDLGFYPGDRNEKLLQNFIGSILTNKLGDQDEVFRLIDENSLSIYPFSDIRGIEIPKDDIMYITEAQNLSIDLIKLALQRCAEGSKIIIEGDPHTQVDKFTFKENNNGLLRVLDVFTGDENNYFSYIYLPNIYRSKIALKAEEL